MIHFISFEFKNFIIENRNYSKRMSKSPNALNLNSYTQGEGAQVEYSQEPTDRELESQTIEEQFDNFVKDIQNYNEIINELAKNVDRANAQQYFITDFYPQFALNNTYEDDEEKRIVASTDPQLARIMENLQRNNRILKEQLKGWLYEFSKKTRLSEILITQNQILRKRLCTKNKEIVKLIETINRTQNSDLVELNQTLNQLKQQNGVLLDHLKKIKQSIYQKKIQQKKLIQAYDKTEREKIEIQAKIAQAEDDEEHFSKQINLLESSIDQMAKRQIKLQNQKNRLNKVLEDYRKDQIQIEKQLENCNIDRKDIQNQLKRKYQTHHSEKKKLLEEIDEISEQMRKAKDESKDLQSQIHRNQHKIEEFKKMSLDLDKKIKEGEIKIKDSEKQLIDVINAETQYLSDIDMINFDIQVLKEELKELEEEEQAEEQKYKEQLRKIEEEKKRQLQQWTEQYQKVQRQSCTKILQEKSELAFKKRQIDDWQRKIGEKNEELSDLKSQLKQIKENQGRVIELRRKMRDAKLE